MSESPLFRLLLPSPSARFQGRFSNDIKQISTLCGVENKIEHPASHQMYLESKFTFLLERAILDLLEAHKDKEIAVAASSMIRAHLRRQNIDPDAVLPSLVKQKSNQAEEAGDGIFVSSSLPILKGSIITGYRGIAYEPSDLSIVYALQPGMLTENDYILTRYDETLLDGSPSDASRNVYASLNSLCASANSLLHLGSYINHSSEHHNAIPIGLDVVATDECDQKTWNLLEAILPSRPFGKTLAKQRKSKQVFFLATRDIQPGEEILFNYNYSTSPNGKPVPAWYK